MPLDIEDRPPETSPRLRLVRFTKAEVQDVLMAHCRAEGMSLGGDYEIAVLGLEYGHGHSDEKLTLRITG